VASKGKIIKKKSLDKLIRDTYCFSSDDKRTRSKIQDLRLANIRSISASSSFVCRRFDTIPDVAAGTRGAIAI